MNELAIQFQSAFRAELERVVVEQKDRILAQAPQIGEEANRVNDGNAFREALYCYILNETVSRLDVESPSSPEILRKFAESRQTARRIARKYAETYGSALAQGIQYLEKVKAYYEVLSNGWKNTSIESARAIWAAVQQNPCRVLSVTIEKRGIALTFSYYLGGLRRFCTAGVPGFPAVPVEAENVSDAMRIVYSPGYILERDLGRYHRAFGYEDFKAEEVTEIRCKADHIFTKQKENENGQ